VIKRL